MQPSTSALLCLGINVHKLSHQQWAKAIFYKWPFTGWKFCSKGWKLTSTRRKTSSSQWAPKFLCVHLKLKHSFESSQLLLYIKASLRESLQVPNSLFLWLMGSVDVVSVVEWRQMLENSIPLSPLREMCLQGEKRSPWTPSLSSISIIRARDLTASLLPRRCLVSRTISSTMSD